MSIIGTVHEDVTTDVLGHIGTWQWLVTFVSATLSVPSMLNQYEDMFLLAPPRGVECFVSDASSIFNTSLCTFTVLNGTKVQRCNAWHVKFLWVIWIKKSWLIFCDPKIKALSTTIICRLGLVFGCIIFGLVADSFGRKLAITIDVIAELGFRLILTFCNSESWFLLVIFLRSLFASANIYMGIILTCEIASVSWRTLLNTIVSIPRMLATVCAVPLANSAPNAETFNFIACLFSASILLLLRWTPESPQWLLYNRRIPRAEKILVEAAKVNGIELCSDFKIRPVNHRAYHCLDESWACVNILTTHNIKVLSLTILVFWALYLFLYSSLYIRIQYKQPNYGLLKTFCFIIALGLLNWCLSKNFKMKTLVQMDLAIIGSSSVALILSNMFEFHISPIANVISPLALAAIVIVHGLMVNITPRLFAINIRATLLGCCHSVGHLGSLICCVIVTFQVMNDQTLMFVEAGLVLLLIVVCSVLPDVDGREMPDVLEDMDYFSELSKPLRWASQKTKYPSREEIELRVYSFGSAKPNPLNDSDDRPPAKRIGWLHIEQLFRKLRKT
ncbi:solute carrier family 22 member 21-like [Bicyclus anynana]|uniref:Solute carrier family 22 member 21-like n=1 Tax=Bicyclus anynana TaxID=110368 RepID=A0A6J1MMT2_BICAN|nr:solute carrier family 22 member 21-like [Bicyclus anynana]